MSRTYELGFIVDTNQTDDEVTALTDRYREILEGGGASITHVDYWGRRKLAYPIEKKTEGKYVFVYFSADTAPAIPEVERLMRQNDKVMRYLTVRTDQDIKRAMRKGKVKPTMPGAAEETKDDSGEQASAS